ncbi:hypothetical protein HanIR_Chr09g0415881 [Helianthus annuus]|nr:hypothetical protein HanIR_Chr09g0415881 [Helianthus annuus]
MRSQKMCHKKPVTIGTIMKTPVRFISKALDLYVKGVNNFSSTYNRPFSTTKVNANYFGGLGENALTGYLGASAQVDYPIMIN